MPGDSLRALAGNDVPVVVEPAREARASVIWLHGLGADGHDFEAVVPEFDRRELQSVRFVFPHAPRRSVTVNGGVRMRAWYDIADLDLSAGEDAAGVLESARLLAAYVEREVDSGISARHIVVAGFSQGGAIALHTGLRYPQRLAGILALSTYLPLADSLEAEADPANGDTPIFMAHGSQDPMIALAHSEASRARLSALGYVVECHTYPMAHAVCAEELRDIADWLSRVLGER